MFKNRIKAKISRYCQCQLIFVKICQWFKNCYKWHKNGNKDNVKILSNTRFQKKKTWTTRICYLRKNFAGSVSYCGTYMLHGSNTVTSANGVTFFSPLKYTCAAAKCCFNPSRFTNLHSPTVRDNTIYLTEAIIVSVIVNVIIIHACFICRFYPEYYIRVTTWYIDWHKSLLFWSLIFNNLSTHQRLRLGLCTSRLVTAMTVNVIVLATYIEKLVPLHETRMTGQKCISMLTYNQRIGILSVKYIEPLFYIFFL